MKLYFTQIAPPPADLLAQVRTKGWQPMHFPFREVVLTPCDFARDLFAYDLVVASSKHALTWFEQLMPPDSLKVAVVGNASNAMLRPSQRFFTADAPVTARELGDQLREKLPAESHILLLQGQQARPTLKEALHIFHTDIQIVYHTQLRSTNFIQPEQPSMVYFQAPSAVQDYQQRFSEPPTFVAAIGPTTAHKLQQMGWPIHFQPSRPELTCFAADLPQASDFARRHANSKSSLGGSS